MCPIKAPFLYDVADSGYEIFQLYVYTSIVQVYLHINMHKFQVKVAEVDWLTIVSGKGISLMVCLS